jgi:uncharacterized protein
VLQSTFVHLPGVGLATERSLWSQGCKDWDCLLEGLRDYSIGSASRELARQELIKSKDALAGGVHQYFQKALRSAQAWRAFPEFRQSCVYLDIETDGGSDPESVTMIGLFDGREFKCLIKGEDLEDFRDIISHYSMIVTFFGAGFDLPVLQKRFPGLVLDQIHIDLCPALRILGYTGGLKKIEKMFGLQRSEETEGLSGYDAVRLWRQYCRGSENSLETLVAYNREDVVNLEPLMESAYLELQILARSQPRQVRAMRSRPQAV